ncbi:hypothetical protein BD779DRAFT_608147 [Infundibulicybe gibba]|nr:hypothetical protein BD779DRAFT_608147 [Infundibulicybe gibba]
MWLGIIAVYTALVFHPTGLGLIWVATLIVISHLEAAISVILHNIPVIPVMASFCDQLSHPKVLLSHLTQGGKSPQMRHGARA